MLYSFRFECELGEASFKKPGGDFPGPKFSVGWIRSHVHSLYNFLSCVDEAKKATPSFQEGAYVQYVMEKAYEADQKKCWIDLV